jgi:hypothetical protein
MLMGRSSMRATSLVFSLFTVLATTIAACATGLIDPGSLADGGGGDGDGGGGSDGGACTSMCSGKCADLKTDSANCGKCGTVCPTGATCVQGSCQCTATDSGSAQTKCGSACVDTKTDNTNCGKCGTLCGNDAGAVLGGGTWACLNGTCGITCPMNKTECGGACVDMKTDNDNCGSCSNACVAMTEQCTQGLCCKLGQTVCGGADGGAPVCTDTQFDPMNCGICGKTCGMGTPACVAGVCTSALTYSKAFTGLQVPPAQHCTDWLTFRQQLPLNARSITIKGSNDSVGVTCTGAPAAQIVTALKNGTTVNVSCNARSWGTGNCVGGNDWGVSGDGAYCTCTTKYALRPCINHQDWGGVNSGGSCGQPSQTLTVVVQ